MTGSLVVVIVLGLLGLWLALLWKRKPGWRMPRAGRITWSEEWLAKSPEEE